MRHTTYNSLGNITDHRFIHRVTAYDPTIQARVILFHTTRSKVEALRQAKREALDFNRPELTDFKVKLISRDRI